MLTLLPQLPGERKRVTLVALSGERIVYGGNGWIDGQLDEAGTKQQALEKYPQSNNMVL